MNNKELATVFIRNNETGEIVSYDDEWCFFDDGKFNKFIWEEGNYACDCNRELFFYRAKNIEEPEDTECGEERFSVRIIRKSSGAILYSEF